MWTKLRQSYQLHGSSVKEKEGTSSSGHVILKKVTELSQSSGATSVNRRKQMGNSASINSASSPVQQLSGSGSQSSGIATDESGTMDSSPLNSDTELSTPEISQKSQESSVSSAKDNSALKNHCPLNCCWDTGSERASLVVADVLKVDDGDGTLKNPALEQDIPLDTERKRQPLLKNLSRDSGLVPSDNEKSPSSPHKPLNGRSASLDSGNALTPTRTLNTGLPQWPLPPPSKIMQGKSKSCYEIGCNLHESDLVISPTNVKYPDLTKSCSSVHSTSSSVVPKECIIPAPYSRANVNGRIDSDQSLVLSAKSGEMFASTSRVCSRTAVNVSSVLPPSNTNMPPRSMSAQALNVHGSTITCKPHELHQHTLPRGCARASDYLPSPEVSSALSPNMHHRTGNCSLTETSAILIEEGCSDALPQEPACPSVTTPARHLIIQALNRATLRHNSTSPITSSTEEECLASAPHQDCVPSDAASGQEASSDITGGKVASLESNRRHDVIGDAAVPTRQESVAAVKRQGPLPWVMGDTVDAAAQTGTSKVVETVEKQLSDEIFQDDYEAIIREWEEYLQNVLPQTNEDATHKSAKQPSEPVAAATGTGFAQLLEMVRLLECISRVYDERARSGNLGAQQPASPAVPGSKKSMEVPHSKVVGAQDSENRRFKMKTLTMAQELPSGLSRLSAARTNSTFSSQPTAMAAGAIPKRRHRTLWPASTKRHSVPSLPHLHGDLSHAGVQPDDCVDGAMTFGRQQSRAPWKSLRALFKRSKAVKHSHSADSTYSRSENVDDIKETEEFSAAS